MDSSIGEGAGVGAGAGEGLMRAVRVGAPAAFREQHLLRERP